MKLGFLTAKVTDIEKAARLGFQAIEMQARGFGDMSETNPDKQLLKQAKQLGKKHKIEITAVAYYRCATKPSDVALARKEFARVFDVAEALGVQTVAAMSGFNADLDWKGNLQFFGDRFGPVSQMAEKRGLRVAFENWMGFWGRLPFRPVTMGGSPDTWDDLFKTVPSKALGIEFDPSHLYWQGIDHIRALKEYKHRVYHVHAKDTEMMPENRYRGGVNGAIYRFRIPGYGEINWPAFVSALDEIGYRGGVAIEHEDPIYSGERFDEGLVRGWQTLNPLIK
jgi:sugar phosphate isomerase/epimerase